MAPRLFSIVPFLVLAAAAPVSTGCGAGTPASNLAKAPDFQPANQTKCQIAASKSEPLIVEWPSAARGKLEALSKRGLVAVSYSGCEMEVLSACKVPGSYAYTAITRKHDHVTVHDEDELYAKIPLGAASLEGTLQRAGQLDVSMTIVGRMESDRNEFADLRGSDCARATHVISALTLGAFDFSAGADASVGGGAKLGNAGAGASSRASRELLNSDGEESRCSGASASDARPPDGCGAIVRLEVTPIRPASSRAKIAPPAEPDEGRAAEGTFKPGPPLPAAPVSRLGDGQTLRITAADDGLKYSVSVEAGDGMHACDAPVTSSQPCTLSGLPSGGARLHVSGDDTEDKNLTLDGHGTATVTISRRGHLAEWIFAPMGVAGVVMTVVGLKVGTSDSVSSTGQVNTNFVGPVVLDSVGIALAATGIYGFFLALRRPAFSFTMDRLGAPPQNLAVLPSPIPGGGMMNATLKF
ncbi:MAG: hypothetical protein ABSE49_07345 [Polyangiaceae bacterium]|jgi:hypothetical protein